MNKLAAETNTAREVILKKLGTTTFPPVSTYAYEFDNDNDGTNEIIEKINSSLHCGQQSCAFFILKNKNGNWENIAYEILAPVFMLIKPLNSSTDGFRDFEIINLDNNHTSIIRYNKEKNTYTYD